MSERKRILLLISIMATVSLTIGGIAVFLLYLTAFEEEKARLVETAQSQARLIEAVARFDSIYSQDYPEGPVQATLSQIIDAHKQYKGFGETGEFTLARRKEDKIVFLLSHRHADLQNPKPVLFNSQLAEPMRKALLGLSGTIVGLDYRGEKVLAAHEPVQGLGLGIVAKIDMTEVQKPFIRSGLLGLGVAILVVFAGAGLFVRISKPIIRDLEERSANLTTANEKLKREIEERKEAEKALRESENRFRALTVLAPVGIYLTDKNGHYQYVNERWCEMIGMSHEQAWGDGWIHGLHPDDRDLVSRAWEKMVESEGEWGLEYRFQTPQGKTTFVLGLASPMRDADGQITSYIGANSDITYLKETERQLRVSLNEKDVLLKEVHHRVKNNIQIVSGLLNISGMKTSNQEAKDVLQDARSKVFSMALIHSQLYQQEQLDAIDMGTYTHRLMGQLSNAYNDRARSILTVVEPSDVYLTLNQAIPCSLVINELVSNALKHAFTERQKGTVAVSVSGIDDNMVTIKVKDDGIGIPEGVDIDKPKTMGLELVKGLVNQLGGTVQFRQDKGTEVIVKFKSVKEEKQYA